MRIADFVMVIAANESNIHTNYIILYSLWPKYILLEDEAKLAQNFSRDKTTLE